MSKGQSEGRRQGQRWDEGKSQGMEKEYEIDLGQLARYWTFARYCAFQDLVRESLLMPTTAILCSQ